MGFKFAFMISVALITEVLTRGHPDSITEGIKNQIPQEFIEVYKNMDDFGDNVTLSSLNFYLKENNSEAVECIKQRFPAYGNFTQKFSQQINEVAKNHGQFFVKKYEEYGKKLQGSLNRMANALTTYPFKIKYYINVGDLDKAAKFVDDFRTRIKFNDILYTAEMKRFTTQKPEAAKRAKEVESLYRGIRQQAMKNSKAISSKIKNCIGGSQKVATPPKGLVWSAIDLWSF